MMKTNMLKLVREETQRKKLKRLTRMIVFFLRHEDLKKLRTAVRFTTEEFCKAAKRHGLKVNFGVAKTEALLVLRGAGKKKKATHNPSCWSRTQNCGTVQAHGLDVNVKWCSGS